MEDKIRVLPVDDNPAILKLIGDFLSQKKDVYKRQLTTMVRNLYI